jgi:hypothetical protein
MRYGRCGFVSASLVRAIAHPYHPNLMQAGTSKTAIQTGRARRHVGLSLAIHAAFCLLGLGSAFWPAWTSGFRQVVAARCDGLLNNYFLEHSFQLVANPAYRGTLWEPLFFYPTRNVLSYSDNLFGSAPIYWCFRLMFGPYAAFECWMATVMVLSYAAFAYLLARHRVGHVLSGIGGFLFAFGMPRIMQMPHSQLLPQFLTPLALLFLFGMMRQPTLWRMNLVALLIFWQLLAGIYLGWFCALGSAVYVVVALLCDGQARRRFSAWIGPRFLEICTCCAAWALVIMVVFGPYAQEARLLNGGRDFVEVDPMLPRLASWLSPPPGTFWYPYLGGFATHLSAKIEHSIFNGFVMWAAALLAVPACMLTKIPTSRRALIRLTLLTFAAIFLLSYRFSFGTTLWTWVFDEVPGAKAIRAVPRIWTIAYAFLLFGGLLGIDALLRKTRYGLPIAVALATFAVAEQLSVSPPIPHYDQFVKDTAQDASLIRGADAAYVMIDQRNAGILTDGDPNWLWQTMAMMWAGIQTNVPVVNGYSAWWPPGFGRSDQPMAPDRLIAFLGGSWRGTLRIVADREDAKAYLLITNRWPGARVTESDDLRAFTIVLPQHGSAVLASTQRYNHRSQ